MFNLIMILLVLSPYTAILVGLYTTYKVYKEREYYSLVNWNTWNIGLMLLFIWSFIVGIVNKSVISTLASFAFILYFSLSVYVQEHCDTEEKISKMAHCLLNLSVLSGILGLIEKVVFNHYQVELWRKFLGVPMGLEYEHRIASTFVNSNVAGDWFAIMIIIALFYEGRSTDKRQKVLYGAMVLLFLANLCLTGSRGAFAGLIVGLMCLFILKGNKKNIVAFILIVGIIGIAGFMPTEVSAISDEITGHEIERSFDTREDIWKGSMHMVVDKPITGWGLVGTIEFGKRYFSTDKVVNHSHNIWLSLMTSMGILGLFIYIIMRLRVYRSLFYLYRENSSMLPVLIAIQAVALVHGTIDFTIITPQIGVLFMGSSSLILALGKEEVRSIPRRNSVAI